MIEITTEFITLQQFLKFADIAQSGGEAKLLCKTLNIQVNGESENRRGRKLYPCDVITVDGKKFEISK